MSADKFDPSFTPEPQTAVPWYDAQDSASSPQAKCSVQWAAGFADGEGCINICRQRYKNSRRKTTYRLGFYITQNHWETLEYFRQSTGITQTINNMTPRPGLTRQVYTLSLTGKSALRLITLLYPYLVRKKLEAEAAFHYWEYAENSPRWVRGPRSAEELAKWEYHFQLMRSLK